MSDPAAGPEVQRPLRADARRNRARILAAAETVFSSRGRDASTEEVAREAGVAIGTVFRHFPTKQDLVEAVFVARLHRLVDDAEELAAGAAPAGAFYAFLARWAELSASKHLLADALVSEEVDIHSAAVRAYPQVRDELFRVVSALLARAQAAGAVRADVGIEEVSALLVGMAHAAEHTRGDPAVGARTLEVICDGLRPPRRPAPGGS